MSEKSIKKLNGVDLECARFLMTCGTVTHDNNSLTWSPIGACNVDRNCVTNDKGNVHGIPIGWRLGGIQKIKNKVYVHWLFHEKDSGDN